MNSESGQRLSVEELKRLNLPPQSAPMLPAHPPQQEWSKQLARLERLEASAGAQEAMLRTMVGMVVLRTIWSCLASVWNAVKVLIP